MRVRNNSSRAYQLLSLSFATDGGDIVFDVTALLPGAEMTVLSKEAVPYNADLLVSNVTAIKSLEFTETPSLNSDIFELSASGGVLGVKNISGKQVGNVYVYYKSTDSNGLFGGITYRIKLGDMPSGKFAKTAPPHFDGGSKILYITYV